MNITSLNHITIQGKSNAWKNQIGSFIKANPQKTNHDLETFKGFKFQNSESTVDIGNISFIKFELYSRFSKSAQFNTDGEGVPPIDAGSNLIDSSYDEGFIEDLALEYYNCKNEIAKEYSGDEKASRMKLLTEVYDDVVKKAANLISGAFENFFDYSSNALSRYKMADENCVFDRQEFENNMNLFAQKALEAVDMSEVSTDSKELRASIENNLKSIKEGSCIEKMSYSDVKTLAAFLKTIPKLMPSLKGDMHEVENITDKWNDAMASVKNSSILSDNVKRQAIDSMKNNIHAYHMVSAYVHDMNGYANMIESLMDEYSKLAARHNKIKDSISLYSNYSDTRKIKMLLMNSKLESEITSHMKDLKDQIEDIQNKRNDLGKNPRKIIESDTYKELGKDVSRTQS